MHAIKRTRERYTIGPGRRRVAMDVIADIVTAAAYVQASIFRDLFSLSLSLSHSLFEFSCEIGRNLDLFHTRAQNGMLPIRCRVTAIGRFGCIDRADKYRRKLFTQTASTNV